MLRRRDIVRLIAGVCWALCMLCMAACSGSSVGRDPVKVLGDGEYVTDVEERTIEIAGLEGEYHFLFFSDMHILVLNDEVYEGNREMMEGRRQAFSNNGRSSAEIYDRIIRNANKVELDGVLLGGDIIDFLSHANSEHLAAGLEQLEAPYLFVPADHDLMGWWTEYSEEEQEQMRQELDYEPVQVLDYGEFLVVGISNNTSQLKESALARIKEIFAQNRPVILVQHVPIDSKLDDGFRKKSRENWEDRVLLWGDEGSYEANDTTQEFLDLVDSPESPVVAVLAGHLHFRHEGMINDHVEEFVFNPAYEGEVAYITVKGVE